MINISSNLLAYITAGTLAITATPLLRQMADSSSAHAPAEGMELHAPGLMALDTPVTDSTKLKNDSLANLPYKPSKRPSYVPQDRFGDPFANRLSITPMQLKDPTILKLDAVIDTNMNYTIFEKIGDIPYRPTTFMSFQDFNNLQTQQMVRDYWKEKSAALDGESTVAGRQLIPKIYVSPVFDRVFGGSYVDIKPTGFATLDFGMRYQRVFNTNLPVRQQRNFGFEFDQQISMNVTGKVGEKLSILTNYDNNNSFDFENDIRLEYSGFDEEIIKKLELGNVSLPLNNTLMSGAQNLFGFKTQLQFGKLFVTAVASTQQGKSNTMEFDAGGAQGRQFQIQGSDYDENRHFFLGHFFRDNYENWLAGMPQITSGVNITRVEVYVLNRNNDTETLRNVVALMDLGESRRLYLTDEFTTSGNNLPTDNDANNLWDQLRGIPDARSVDQVGNVLEAEFSMQNARDYVKINGARKLQDREYTFNPQQGYLSLNRRLQNDEMLAVAYEYTYNGEVFKVGELTEDYQQRPDDEVIFLKMLRPNKINSQVPSWDLMMKNVYSLNANSINREGFQLRIIYRDDQTGIDNPSLHEGRNTKDIPLIELVGLDRLNQSGDPQKDGNFDFVEGVTVLTNSGLIVFPVLEPFGSQLEKQFDDDETFFISKYVYDTLYRTTRADAQQIASLNKYFITGEVQSGSSTEIMLPGLAISEGSVQVLAGSTPLTEGVDYTIDYQLGRVRILNEGVLASGKKIRINYENADLFNFRSRSLVGARADYQMSDDINMGATMLYLTERPIISRNNVGDEPTRNVKYGVDLNYRKDSRMITRAVDLLPFIQTKETSTIQFSGEMAQLIPGTSNKVQGEGTSYIDAFETSVTPFSLMSQLNSWKLAATPEVPGSSFDLSGAAGNGTGVNYRRAHLSWYVIDQGMYQGLFRPNNLEAEDFYNHYVRSVFFNEIFPQRQATAFPNPEPILDLAYFPYERGPYNYNTNLNQDGHLQERQANWAGITRAITNEVDFDKSNIEYLEFWMLDPFIEGENGVVQDGVFNQNNTTGGKLLINLGSVSEDVMKDDRHAFEHGLPANENDIGEVIENDFGRVTTKQYLANAFPNSTDARPLQDVGLDGLDNDGERAYFQSFIQEINSMPLTPEARQRILDDPSHDDFHHYFGDDLDAADAGVIDRYRNWTHMEGNSPVGTNSDNLTGSSNLPDNEDLNQDNTLATLEEYYEYEIDLRRGGLEVGSGYVVDRVTSTIPATGDQVNWYLFRVPVRQPNRVQGDISGFKSIRYVRMYMTDWAQPVVLRMAKLQLVGSEWRKYQEPLFADDFGEVPEPEEDNFTIAVVNIEENNQSDGQSIPYTLPPDIQRDRDITSAIPRDQNESSLALTVNNLKDNDARGAFKSVNLDLVNYGRIKMFLHANTPENFTDTVSAFLRLGTDLKQNYYEIEVPLVMTPRGQTPYRPEDVWPVSNEIDMAIAELYALKSERNRLGRRSDIPFPETPKQIGNQRVTVVGNPDLSTILFMMIGMRNPESEDREPHTFTIWANELRVTDFDRTAGWAANARLQAKLADLANITASTRYTSVGFGGIQSRISERTREETTEFDVSANIQLGKFFPEKSGIRLPLFLGYQTSRGVPFFDPTDPDTPLEAALLSFDTDAEREAYRAIVEDRSTTRSLNITNVGKTRTNMEATPRIYHIENWSLSYSYSELIQSNLNTAQRLRRNYRGGVAYQFNPEPFVLEPLKEVGFLKSPWLQLIRDANLNFTPNSLSMRADLDRRFTRTQLRNADLTTDGILPNFEKAFNFNRNYSLRWNLTSNLNFDYSARANAIIDEPEGDLNSDAKRDSVLANIQRLGRMKNFNQSISANYRLPLDKIPLTSFMSADVRYQVNYMWRAGSIAQQDTLGNFIENSQNTTLNGRVDFTKIYNKVPFLANVNQPQRRSLGGRGGPPEEDTTRNIMDSPFMKGTLRFLMMVRSVNFSYSLREGTSLPGFMPQPFLFGLDSSFSTPGIPFVLGSQDPNIRLVAAQNGWMAPSAFLTAPFTQNQTVDISARATIEPLKDVRINLNVSKKNSGNYQEIFRFDTTLNNYNTFTPSRKGSYDLSYFMLATTFDPIDANDESEAFQNMESFRSIIRDRLNAQNPAGEYQTNAQDVLIPAFIAAYSGQDPNLISTSPFPSIPLPNWKVDYSGLTNIGNLKDYFASITLSHGYTSRFAINNFSNSLVYDEGLDLALNIEDYPLASQLNDAGELVPVFILNQVTMREQFQPLIGINVRTKDRLTAKFEYRKERNLGLNLSNAQVTEQRSEDFVFDVGYIKSNMKMPWKAKGREVILKNDLNMRMSFTLRDTRTWQRKLDEGSTVTNGTLNLQIRPSAEYTLNQRLNIRIYGEYGINNPAVSAAYRRNTAYIGTQVRFNLAQQ